MPINLQEVLSNWQNCPLGVRSERSKDVKRLHRIGVIEHITASGRVAPILEAMKKNIRIRGSVDMKAPKIGVIPDFFFITRY